MDNEPLSPLAAIHQREEHLRDRQSFYASKCVGLEDREGYLLDGIEDDASNDLDEALGLNAKLLILVHQLQTAQEALKEKGL